MPVSSHMSSPLARFSGDVIDCLDDDVLLDNSTALLSRKPFSGEDLCFLGQAGRRCLQLENKERGMAMVGGQTVAVMYRVTPGFGWRNRSHYSSSEEIPDSQRW